MVNLKGKLYVQRKEPDPEGFFIVTPDGEESPLSADMAVWLHQGKRRFLKSVEVKVNIDDRLYPLQDVQVFFYEKGKKVSLW